MLEGIVFMGTMYSRHVFMILMPKTLGCGITELCARCGNVQCKCGKNEYVCTTCARLLQDCTCLPEIESP